MIYSRSEGLIRQNNIFLLCLQSGAFAHFFAGDWIDFLPVPPANHRERDAALRDPPANRDERRCRWWSAHGDPRSARSCSFPQHQVVEEHLRDERVLRLRVRVPCARH